MPHLISKSNYLPNNFDALKSSALGKYFESLIE